MHLNRENWKKCCLMGENLLGMGKWTEDFMFLKKFWPQGIICPCPRCYIHVYFFNIQTSSLKPLGQSKPNFMWSILKKRGRKYINGPGNMTKMAAMSMPIYGKNL